MGALTAVGSETFTLDATFRALGPAVRGYLRSAGAEDADDVLGEVFVGVARGIRRFEGDEDALRRWVFTIAYRCLVDERRSRSRRARLLHRSQPKDAPAPDEPFDPELVRALHCLTPEQREVVTLRFVADLSIDEVARITGRPSGAVKSLQHRALRQLGQLLRAAPVGER
jgi:RNA polymerase sigma-70 factor (ECF subfamily)